MEFEDNTYFLTKLAKIAVHRYLKIIKFSVICVSIYVHVLSLVLFFPFFNPTPFVFFKDISCLNCCIMTNRLRSCLHDNQFVQFKK